MLRSRLGARGDDMRDMFQWAPTLGGECYEKNNTLPICLLVKFQWAPTLGGECYRMDDGYRGFSGIAEFQWAPTLGGECYRIEHQLRLQTQTGFNGHPPLGVNATHHDTA